MDLISPRFRKLVALALLIVAVWLAANLLYLAVMQRMRLHAQISDLRQRYEDLRARRIDMPSLKDQLAQLTSSGVAHHAAIMARTDRAAAAALQQLVRGGIERSRGRLLSLTDLGADRSAFSVAVQVRARLSEPALSQWIDLTEGGEPGLYIEDISIAWRPQPSDPALPLEIAATLRARWLLTEEASR
jgi:Type II secretion system (T2SS), protein M subtype b